MLDHAAVGGRDDQDGEGRRRRQEDGEVGVLAEVLERFFRAVGRGGETVRAQADPGKEGHQRDVPEEVGILQVLRAAQKQTLQALPPSRTQLRLRRRRRRRRAHGG